MKSIPTKILKQFKEGSEWQHKVSLEVVWILSSTLDKYSDGSQELFVLFLTQDGYRKQLDHKDFLEYYKLIPPMKGIYK